MKKINFITAVLLSAGLFAFSGCGSAGVVSNAEKTAVSPALILSGEDKHPAISDRKFEQVPAIGATKDGDVIYAAWYSGGNAPGPGNFVTVAVSTDKGSTWMNDKLVIMPENPGTRFFDPAIWRDKDGSVRLFYGSSEDSLLWDGRGGVNMINLNWNGSEITYDKPQRIADGVMSNKPLYLKSKNITLFPVYVDPPVEADTNKSFPESGAFILSHDYSSKNLNLTSYGRIKIPEQIRIHDEPQVVETSDDGDFLALVRTTEGIYFSTSSDYGKTWNGVRPFTASGPTTSSRFYIGKLASGNLLLISNNSTTRNNMTAFLSKDGGKTWPHKLLLDSRENVSYPDADQTSDGTIHVIFDRDRTGAKDILYCNFKEEDILNGDSGAVFKKRVNN